MLIGIMSDSHDNVRGVKEALDIFKEREAEMVLHAGDMIGSGNCYAFKGSGMDIRLVYGNNDGDREGLMREFVRVGGQYLGDFGEIEADGLKIAMLHGTEEPLVRATVASGLYDIVVRGHNHRAEVTQYGKTMLINPGEIWGHFTGQRSLALLDTATRKAEIVDMGRCWSIRDVLKEM